MHHRFIIISALLAVLVNTGADAQIFQRRAHLDSIRTLQARIDSLQAAYDELYMLTVQGQPIEMTDEDDDFSVDEFAAENHNTDSLLSVWYVEHDLSSAGFELPNVDDTVFVSDLTDSLIIERLNKMNSFIKIPYSMMVRKCDNRNPLIFRNFNNLLWT